jgi:DNA-binding IclR family transcriptional regulator
MATRRANGSGLEPGGGGSQTLARGLKALRVIAEAVDGMSATELAQVMSIHLSAVYRLLRPLVDYGFLRRDQDGRYRPGVLFIHLAEQTRYGVRSAALPVMTPLAEQTGATAMLLAADGPDAVVLAVVEPSVVPYRIRYMEGERHPLDRGSASYALLARRSPRPDEPEAVRVARRLGFARSEGEVQGGVFGLAIALDSQAIGTEFCINLASRSQSVLMEGLPALQTAVARLTEILGALNGERDLVGRGG